MNEKHITTQIKAPYYTYGNKNQLKNVWVVCHGYGQLAKHFIKRFDILNPDENYVIAVQGLSKLYVDSTSGNVGASWMTKEDRLTEIENQYTYLKQVFDFETKELNLEKIKLNFLGFSQGVTTTCRWINNEKLAFDKLILWAGGFPHELENKVDFINPESKIIAVVGTEDQYFNETSFNKQIEKVTQVFKEPEVVTFKGKHEIQRDVLLKVINM